MTAVSEHLAVKVRYFAGARAAAGVAEEVVRLARPADGRPVRASDLIEAVLSTHGERLAEVVPACSFLLDGVAVRDRAVEIPDGAEFDVLPPFAGG
ncbi:molybdopterin converting factor small subunit [Saccharopolyspora erythraea NRRL 2338]|uniref:MoaD2 n=2 Tax=Saccharopolyspora erythraea TaxID=1836 RepID=A4F789_SACEN|nr:MoaD/ThiS family protein [Saccharopolyspora erythraea]EQD86349.1 ThiS/MoaD family protein [Saccharopolyspora erythraea D]PFG93716.1 molybdopterin converting factor small subunit [Saccharopolyspora erythraea NRRL 2338]QRK90558.1 MoaD/ThiS family protein [Saccharopolyspora erythraea]CAL99913.1 MoaD2 [Saccharopolyspora erythraea NRRL 2338]